MTMMVSRRDAGMLYWQNLLPKAGRGGVCRGRIAAGQIWSIKDAGSQLAPPPAFALLVRGGRVSTAPGSLVRQESIFGRTSSDACGTFA
jgi:hypothetical protein